MDIDVVLPVYNEAPNLEPLVGEIDQMAASAQMTYNVIAVDDGSTDESWSELRRLSGEYESVRGLRFGTNRGQSTAFLAGFQCAESPVVVTMDADGQNDPADVPGMMDHLDPADVVAGYREHREDTVWKKAGAAVANRVRNWVTGDDVIDTGCSLKLFRQEVVNQIPMFQGMHRFLPTLAKMKGFEVTQVPVHHRARWEGTTSYTNLGRLRRTVWDLLAVRWMQSRVIQYEVERTLNLPVDRC